MKILNLYACLGGNRYKWGEEHDITAVEWDEELARLYQERFPSDKVIVADAHQYLLDHYKEYDFIWSSPPCPTHSRFNVSMKTKRKMKYPDMALYQEIIFLQYYYDGKYVVENVIPFYDLLIQGHKRNRHIYWTNFNMPTILSERKNPDLGRTKNVVDALSKFHDYDFRKYKGKQSIQKVARNLVDYEAGKTILDTVMGIRTKQNINQTELF
jgi:DNA (cytosine-5)-methyltransferase 1